MPRYAYQNYIKDGMGRVIPRATVVVSLTGTDTPAIIYPDNSSPAMTGNVLIADSSGYVRFFVDSMDYAYSQFFRLSVSAEGYNPQTFDYVSIIMHITAVPDSGPVLPVVGPIATQFIVTTGDEMGFYISNGSEWIKWMDIGA